MPRFLPLRASVEWLKKAAKDRLEVLVASAPETKLHDAQLELAREFGFNSWRAMIAHVEEVRQQLRTAFPVLNAPLPKDPAPVDPNDPELTVFLSAIRDGDATQVATTLARRASLANACGPQGETPLHVAAQFNDVRIALVLLAHDADPEATFGDSGHTVLSWAVTCHALDFARALLRLAVKPDLFTAAGLGALEEVASFFDEEGRLIGSASRSGSTRFTKHGERLPCPPSSKIEQISDGLYIACRNAHADVVRFLLTKGPDLSFKSYLGATPLHWAYFGGSAEVIDLLLNAGANANAIDDQLGCTPQLFGVCISAHWGFLFKVRALLEAEPSLINLGEGQTTALHEAATVGQIEIVQYLLERGADRSFHDRNGKTAADRAEQNGHLRVMTLLRN